MDINTVIFPNGAAKLSIFLGSVIESVQGRVCSALSHSTTHWRHAHQLLIKIGKCRSNQILIFELWFLVQ